MRRGLGLVLVALVLVSCGDDKPSDAEMDDAYSICKTAIAVASSYSTDGYVDYKGDTYAGPNAALVGCMRDKVSGLSFDDAKKYVQDAQENEEWLRK